MPVRIAALGLSALALVLWPAGADGIASLVLLAAIVAASARLLLAVGDAAEGMTARGPVALWAGGLVCLVAAGAAHAPLLALGLFACAALELFGSPAARPDAVAEPVEPIETPVSRAA